MRAQPFLVTIALLSLLTTSLVAPVSSQSLDLPPSYTQTLVAQEGNLYDPWQRSLEKVPFFLDHSDPFPDTEVEDPVTGETVQTVENEGVPPVGFRNGHLTYEPNPTDIPLEGEAYDPSAKEDKRVVIHNDVDTVVPVVGVRPTEPIDFPTEFLLPVGQNGQDDLRSTRDWRLYGLQADIYVSCRSQKPDASSGGDPLLDASIRLELVRMANVGEDGEDAFDESFILYSNTFDMATGATPYGTAAPNVYKVTLREDRLGSWTTGVGHGPSNVNAASRFIAAEDRVMVRIYADVPGASECVLHYGSSPFPSNVVLVTDTASLSAWVEDRNGDYTEGLPTAETSDQANRRMTAKVAQASAWPHLNRYSLLGQDTDYQDRIWGGLVHDGPAGCTGLAGICVGGAAAGANTDIGTGNQRYYVRWISDVDNSVVYDSLDDVDDPTGGDQRNTPVKTVGDRTVTFLEDGLNVVSQDFLYDRDLPDGRYHFEVYSKQFEFQESQQVIVGLKGFTMDLVDFDPSGDKVHEVLPGESTFFLLRLENFGAQSDDIQLSTTSPGTGWSLDMSTESVNLPASTLAPGDDGVEVVLKLTPDDTRTAGTSTTFKVTAESEYPEVPDEVLELTVRVVSAKDRDVILVADDLTLQVPPGQEKIHPLFRVQNLGASQDTFIVEPRLPTNQRGWTAAASPPGRLIPADSIEDFGLRLNVPTDAVPGSTFQLPVSVTRVGDSAVVDTVVLTVEVLLQHGLEFSVPDAVVQLRDPKLSCKIEDEPAPSTGFADSAYCAYENGLTDDNDYNALYRLAIHNPGTVAGTYTLRGDMEAGTVPGATASASKDTVSCDGGTSGNPKPSPSWRANYGKEPGDEILDDVTDNGEGALHNRDPVELDKVVVPAGATVYRWMELGIIPPNPDDPLTATIDCGFFNYSPAGYYRVVATADNEPGIKQTLRLFTERHAADAESTHGVLIEPALDLATSTAPTLQESQLATAAPQSFSEVRHRFYVRNLASERDDLVVRTPSGGTGYSAHLEYVEEDTPLVTSGCNPDGTETPQQFTCRKMGIMEEIYFDLVIQPDATHPQSKIGRDFTHSVFVSNKDTDRSDDLTFTTALVGEARFEAREVVPARDAYPGQDVSLAFQVQNLGTRDDTYSIAVVGGDADWLPRLGTEDQVFVPGQSTLASFLKVQVPETATAGQTKVFVVQVDSSDDALGSERLTFTVDVVADPGLAVQGKDGVNDVILQRGGAPQAVHAEAITSTGSVGDPVTFRVDRASLPADWSLLDAVQTVELEADPQGFVAPVMFEVSVPEGALGSSSVPLVVQACLGDQQDCVDPEDFVASGDVFMNLQDDVGVRLSLRETDVVTATLPGGDVVFPVRVQNGGLSPDVIILTHTDPATGWKIRYDPVSLNLGPLESRVVDVIVSAPTSAKPGDKMPFVLFGTSELDPSEFAQLPLVASIGVFDLEWDTEQPERAGAPDELVRFVASVKNNGTLPDAVVGTARIATETARVSYGSQVQVSVEPRGLELDPGQTKDVTVTVRLGPSVPAGVDVPVEVLLESIPDSPSSVTPTFTVNVLDYKRLDVDDDGIAEYAVDRNQDAGDGYEEFKEPLGDAGKQTRPAQLVRFLSDEGRQKHTVQVTRDNETVDVVMLRIDGDEKANGFGDGDIDLFLDDTGDGLPNIYWDPDDGHASRLSVLKDINADGVPDYFVDTSGNGQFNAIYDLARGTFVRLLVRDVDDDGNPDFVVDRNGNGRVDGDETVLFSREGKLIQVTKVDVDGDGKLDDVFDTDGDGNPDYFVPNGKTKGVRINVDRDLNEDGFLDWSYDANRDGRDDHYYDPAAQSGGHAIDARAEFVRSLQEFWYVGALFILVAALFVVLVAVTRR